MKKISLFMAAVFALLLVLSGCNSCPQTSECPAAAAAAVADEVTDFDFFAVISKAIFARYKFVPIPTVDGIPFFSKISFMRKRAIARAPISYKCK